MIDQFQNVIQDLGALTAVPLHVDENFHCVVNINGELDIFLEPNERDHVLQIGCKLGQIFQGPFRERVFKQMLIANGSEEAHFGYFAFSSKNQQLVFYAIKFLPDLTGVYLADFLESFIANALKWKQAIEKGYEKPDTV